MITDRVLEADVLVVGGGIAGLFAAIKAKEQGANVVLIDKGFAGKSGQSPYAKCFMAFHEDWGHDLNVWMDYIHKTSEYINNKIWTEITIRNSYERYLDLVSWGVEFQLNEYGEPERESNPPGVTEFLNFKQTEKGDYLQSVRKQALKIGVTIVDRVMVTELLKQEDRIVGAVGAAVDTYDFYTIIAKTTILCVGACGFKPAGYPPIVQLTCDGEAMAYRVGAEIAGKEFVDAHSTRTDMPVGTPNMFDRGMNVPENLRVLIGGGRGRPEVNAEGTEFPDRPVDVSQYPFTYLEREFEAHAGRAPVYTTTLYGQQQVVGGACLGMSLRKADGLWPANTTCASSIPGLYAAGDSLGNMQNGAAYTLLGSAAAGSAVTGAIAGESAAKEALGMEKLTVKEEIIAEARSKVLAPLNQKGGFSPRWVTQLLQNTMTPYFVSFIKKEDRLKATLTIIEFIQGYLVPMLYASDSHELRLAHETRNMVLSAEMRLRSALFRTESRGNHYREDYPFRDDENWLTWTKIVKDQDEMKLTKEPIPKEWQPDLSVPYQERYPFRFPGE